MVIVVLEADAVGSDVSYEGVSKYGEARLYNSTPHNLIAERIKDADIVIANKCLMNEETLKGADKLKLIAEAATGYNNIDTEYCRKKGIAVVNISGYSTDSVAQHTFAMLLSLNNKLSYYSEFVNSKEYSNGSSFCNVSNVFHDLTGKTLGILGLGNIGKKVAEIAVAFGMRIIYYSVSGNKQDVPYECVDFDTFLSESDYISVNAPLNDKTRGIINYSALKKMKKSCILINVARGAVVVEADIVRALNEGIIAAAGIDVYEKEPLLGDSPYLTIQDKDRLLLTPHVAWGSFEARKRCVEEGIMNIEAFLNGEMRNRIV